MEKRKQERVHRFTLSSFLYSLSYLLERSDSINQQSTIINHQSKKSVMNSKGMTLVELIVVIVLLGIIGLFTFDFIGKGVETYITTSNQAGLLAEAKLAMERMARDIRDAKSITSPAAGGSGNLITFTRTNATKWDVADESITFHLTGSTLETLEKVKQSPSATTSSMAENVSAFTVTRGTTDDEIKIVLTLSLTGGENVTLHTKVYPKNLPSQFDGDWEEVVQ